jgi:phage gp36-like protein
MFLSITDLSTSLYPEVRELLSRSSETVVLAHCATAQSVVESYLAARYHIGPELAKTGTARHSLLLSIARDIAIYELYQLAETLPNKVVKRYDDAIRLLSEIAKGLVVLPAVPPAPIDTPSGADMIGYGSRTRRSSFVQDFPDEPFLP